MRYTQLLEKGRNCPHMPDLLYVLYLFFYLYVVCTNVYVCSHVCVWHVHKRPKVNARYLPLACFLTTGQERHNKPESSAAKLYCLHLQGQACKPQAQKRKPPAYIFRSQSARAPERRARALLFTSLGARSKSQSQRAKAQERKQEREWRKPRPLLGELSFA